MTYMPLAGVCLLLLLFAAAITDMRQRIIPLELCLLFSMFIILQLILTQNLFHLLSHALAGLLLFALFLINALFFHGGGGDCFLAFCIGLTLGLMAGLYITVFACTAMALYHLLIRKKQMQYPMAPAMLLGTVLYFILMGGIQ
ncbi:MAG: prepilin peptidase [Methanocorpusculum sp.]|nr:prepilin peptidase [Methanocorpusculum sp.]